MRIFYKTREEIEKMRLVSLIVSDVLDVLEQHCVPGVSTLELNEIASRELKKRGATSAFFQYGYPPYPRVLCTSINDCVVHGIPDKDVLLRDGDIIGVDFGAFKDGFCGDSARTVTVGRVLPRAQRLVDATREALRLGIEKCRAGFRLQDIGYAVQSYVESMGYSVVRSFVGHGIGRAMHEDPMVPNYGEPNRGIRMKPGLVIAIEPMVNEGSHEVKILSDGWTAVTYDGSLSAHFEHTVAVTDGAPWVLSQR